MSTYTPERYLTERDDQLLTITQAAQLLAVHRTTIRRWIQAGKLPAFRVGEKGVRVKYKDVADLLTPLGKEQQTAERMGKAEQYRIPRMSPEEQDQARKAIAEVRRLRASMLHARGGKPFPPSWEVLNTLRDERTRDLTS